MTVRRLTGLVDPRDFGASGNGLDDDSQAFRDAQTANKFVKAGPGTYRFATPVALEPGSQFVSEGGAKIRPDGDNAFTAIGAKRANLTDLKVDGYEFEKDIPRRAYAAVYAENVSHLRVTNNRGRNIGLLNLDNVVKPNYTGGSDTPTTDAGIVDELDLSDNVLVKSNYCESEDPVNFVDLAVLRFVRDSKMTDNEGMHAQIYFWGGDANLARGGRPDQPRWARRLNIGLNNITGGNACLWGSMGDDCTIAGNNTREARDVGLDVEGTINTTLTGNTVHNAVNAAMSTFFYCRNVVFNGNAATQDGTLGNVLFMMKNAQGLADNIRVALTGNSMQYTGLGLGRIFREVSCEMKLKNNDLENVVVDYINNNGGFGSMTDNDMLFLDQAAPFSAVRMEKAYFADRRGGRFNGNRVACFPPAPAGSRAFDIEDTDFNRDNTFELSNNETEGFDIPVRVAGLSNNAGRNTRFVVRDNLGVGATQFVVDNSLLGRSTVIEDRNINEAGVLI